MTSNADFYRIDIDLAPPAIDGASWQLQVSGLFDRPRDLTLRDLLAMPAVTQPITQSCISNPIGGDLIGSAYYTGVRLGDVLEELGLQPAAKALALQGGRRLLRERDDGGHAGPAGPARLRHERHDAAGRARLPAAHLHPEPLRHEAAQVDHFDGSHRHSGSGYWVDRGWSQEARPQVISIIDTVAKDSIADGRVPVGGIAWAGDRGIKSVEVQVDDGAWAPANLITPPLGPLTWVQWRYDWPVAPGRHTFRVRATDGKGTLQNGQNQDTYPDGATGYHAVTAAF